MFKIEGCYRFITHQQTLVATSVYRQKLEDLAKSDRAGKVITDEDYPTELFALKPQQTEISPLVLIGGMGALAGIVGLESACQMFGSTREIILLQACTLPNRTTAMFQMSQQGQKGSLVQQLILMLAEAIAVAVGNVQSEDTPVRVVVLCNAAHCFLPLVWQRLKVSNPELSQKIQSISLIESTVQYLLKRGLQRPLLLCTNATRWGKIYSNLLAKHNLELLEPNETLQLTLMNSIYRGVKAFDRNFACQTGNKFWLELLETQVNADCIIAGCSEIPSLLSWIEAESESRVGQFLSSKEIIDPVYLALKKSAIDLPVAIARQ